MAAAACGDPPGPCIGDCGAPIVVAPLGVYRRAVVELADGDPVTIEPPLQGGYVIYVGVRAQNVHGLTTTLTAAVRDAITPQVISLESRPVRLIAGADGWARPESPFQDLANVAVCSIVVGPADFDQATWRLELRLSDSDGRTAETTVRIQPRCDADSPAGGECPTDPIDAGVDAVPPDAAPTDAT